MRAVDASPDDTDLRADLAECLIENGQIEEATTHLCVALGQQPGNHRVQQWLRDAPGGGSNGPPPAVDFSDNLGMFSAFKASVVKDAKILDLWTFGPNGSATLKFRRRRKSHGETR